MKANPLNNWGTAKVFYQLVSGRTNTTEIAESMNVSPPSVSEQLRRLQTFGIVRLGKKEGKIQNYEIDWKRLADLFVERSPKLKFALTSKEKQPDTTAAMLRVQLPKEKMFQKLISEYLKALNYRLEIVGYVEPLTLQNAIDDFEASLLRVQVGLKCDNETKNLFYLLHAWCDILEANTPIALDALKVSLRRVGLWLR